jgi:phospholipase/carboxylesterase
VARIAPGTDRMSDRAGEAYAYHAENRAAGKPLVFVFHGTGGTENQFVPLVRELLPGAAIVAPCGDVSEHGALRFFRRTGEGVYDMDDLDARTDKMVGFLEAHVATAKPSEVLGLGYSNGANILASVIFRRPALLGRAVLMHPLVPWTPDPVPVATRVLITAGEHDPIAPAAGTRTLEAWFRAQGAAVETHWHAGGHDIGRSEISAVARFLG